VKLRPKVSVVALGKSYELEVTNLLNESFCKENPIWNHYVEDTSETFSYVNDIVKRSM
jgi:hypothetical protein